ncbi:MAG TPA: CpaF family protein [Clostridiales bacterium]|nr:CpaF family protein [Clostridiales bacterium]
MMNNRETATNQIIENNYNDAKGNLTGVIKAIVSNRIDIRKDITDTEIRELITSVVFEKSQQVYLSIKEKQEIVESVFNSMRRMGILQPLIDDHLVTEIMINGPDNIFIEKGGSVHKLDIKLENEEKLEDIIQSVVSKANRVVNEASPIVDARLQDGSRVNVVLKPIALNGPVMTIRKFPSEPVTMNKLIELGSITPKGAEFLKYLVKAKYNIFVCGGAGSGKTTFLNALSGFISEDERIITIEDSAELQITGISNLVRLETRNENMEGKGRVSVKDLIKTSLRMRPERIIVGEVRGDEALDMLQAMNTGHDGSLSTGHGNSPRDMLNRLETMVLGAAPLPLQAIRQQIASAIEIIVHLSRMRDKSRKTLEITEVAGFKEGEIVLNPLFEFEDEGDTEGQTVKGSLKRTGNEMIRKMKFKQAGVWKQGDDSLEA